jgi:hypothetical protein
LVSVNVPESPPEEAVTMYEPTLLFAVKETVATPPPFVRATPPPLKVPLCPLLPVAAAKFTVVPLTSTGLLNWSSIVALNGFVKAVPTAAL